VTWLIAIVAGIYGGILMYFVRESARAAGAQIQFPTLWLERTVDILAGMMFEVAFVVGAAWAVSVFMDNVNAWVRQTAVMVVYLGIAAYAFFF
jgi:hypothetical protein